MKLSFLTPEETENKFSEQKEFLSLTFQSPVSFIFLYYFNQINSHVSLYIWSFIDASPFANQKTRLLHSPCIGSLRKIKESLIWGKEGTLLLKKKLWGTGLGLFIKVILFVYWGPMNTWGWWKVLFQTIRNKLGKQIKKAKKDFLLFKICNFS